MESREANVDWIFQLARRIEERRSDLQEAAALDAGFPVKVTGKEIDLAVEHLRTMEEEIPWLGDGGTYGTVGAIFPYDAAPVVLARMGGAALLTGNRLRFSFSSLTPRSAAVIAEVCRPIPMLEPVTGMDNREFGRRCVRDEAVRVLFISGGSAVGEAYRARHEDFDKLFFAGPGGMPAALVFEGADPRAAARFIAQRAFLNGGQYCTTIKKALIHRSVYDALRKEILRLAETLEVGDPLDPKTDIGPIRVERTRRIVSGALDQCSSARVLAGGMEKDFVFPQILEAEPDMTIPDLELFGPFLLLKPFDDPLAAVREAIQTRYGFLLVFFGTPPDGARETFRDNFGMVHENPDFFFSPLRAPFGGKKESGWILERAGDGRWISRDGAFYYSRELIA